MKIKKQTENERQNMKNEKWIKKRMVEIEKQKTKDKIWKTKTEKEKRTKN